MLNRYLRQIKQKLILNILIKHTKLNQWLKYLIHENSSKVGF